MFINWRLDVIRSLTVQFANAERSSPTSTITGSVYVPNCLAEATSSTVDDEQLGDTLGLGDHAHIDEARVEAGLVGGDLNRLAVTADVVDHAAVQRLAAGPNTVLRYLLYLVERLAARIRRRGDDGLVTHLRIFAPAARLVVGKLHGVLLQRGVHVIPVGLAQQPLSDIDTLSCLRF